MCVCELNTRQTNIRSSLTPSFVRFGDKLSERFKLKFAILEKMKFASDHAKFTHVIHPVWSKRQLPSLMHSKCTHSWYHNVALGRGPFRDRLKVMGKRDCDMCRYGCNVTESPEHVLLHCRHVEKSRKVLHRICAKRDLQFSMKTLLNNTHLQIGVEKLMADFMKSSTDDVI